MPESFVSEKDDTRHRASDLAVFALLPRGTNIEYQDVALKMATIHVHTEVCDSRVLFFELSEGSIQCRGREVQR